MSFTKAAHYSKLVFKVQVLNNERPILYNMTEESLHSSIYEQASLKASIDPLCKGMPVGFNGSTRISRAQISIQWRDLCTSKLGQLELTH